MSCVLRAFGKNFEVDRFVSNSPLAVSSIWRKGEQRFAKSLTNASLNESSGLRVVASEAEFFDLSQQIDDVLLFLRLNQEYIKGLSAFPGVEGVGLDVGVDIHPPGWSSFTFPPELLRLAGEAGVSLCLSVYPSDNGEAEDA